MCSCVLSIRTVSYTHLKTLKAILCLSLAVLMGIAAPILAVTMSKNATADALPEGIEAAYQMCIRDSH